jgi:hypothetical protein
MAPLVKLIHPDIFATSAADVKAKNLHFLQSLNELSDTIQAMVDLTERRGSLDVTRPLAPSYRFTFFVKDTSTPQSTAENSVRPITVAMITPTQFTARRTMARDSAEGALRKLLLQLGNLLVAVDLDNPWNVRRGDMEGAEDENGNRAKKSSVDQKKAVPDWVFSQNFTRRADAPDAEGRKVMDHFMKQVELAVEERVVEKEVLLRWDSKRTSRAAFASSVLAGMGRAPSVVGGAGGRGRAAEQRRGNASSGLTEQEAHMMVEVDRFVRNGNVLVSNSPSHVEELAALRRLNAFLTEFGGMLCFSFKHWSGVIIILNGETSGTADRKLSSLPSQCNANRGATVSAGKKKTAAEMHEDLYLVETLGPTPFAAASANDEGCIGNLTGGANGSQKAGGSENEKRGVHLERVVVTIPFNFKPRSLLRHLGRRVPHATLLSGAKLKSDSLI